MSEKGTPPAIFLNFISSSSEHTIAETVIEHKIYRKRNISSVFKGFGIETLNCIFFKALTVQNPDKIKLTIYGERNATVLTVIRNTCFCCLRQRERSVKVGVKAVR